MPVPLTTTRRAMAHFAASNYYQQLNGAHRVQSTDRILSI